MGVKILGIDPGMSTTGFGLVQWEKGKAYPVAYGHMRTDSGQSEDLRLWELKLQMEEVLERHAPDEVAVEQLFFNRNARTALSVGQARGVVLVCCAGFARPVAEYTPLQVKQAVTGFGRAGKKQVQEMVQRLLSLDERPRPADAADALAVALCHAYALPWRERLRGVGPDHV